jgi:hypothetical protein
MGCHNKKGASIRAFADLQDALAENFPILFQKKTEA